MPRGRDGAQRAEIAARAPSGVPGGPPTVWITLWRHKVNYAIGGGPAIGADDAGAASPLACPNCSHPLLADPTVLMRPYLSAAKSDNILKWQRLLAKYAYWYAAMGPRVRRIDAGGLDAEAAGTTRRSSRAADSLAFIGALQEVVHEPPSMLSIASRRTAMRRPPKRLARIFRQKRVGSLVLARVVIGIRRQ